MQMLKEMTKIKDKKYKFILFSGIFIGIFLIIFSIIFVQQPASQQLRKFLDERNHIINTSNNYEVATSQALYANFYDSRTESLTLQYTGLSIFVVTYLSYLYIKATDEKTEINGKYEKAEMKKYIKLEIQNELKEQLKPINKLVEKTYRNQIEYIIDNLPEKKRKRK